MECSRPHRRGLQPAQRSPPHASPGSSAPSPLASPSQMRTKPSSRTLDDRLAGSPHMVAGRNGSGIHNVQRRRHRALHGQHHRDQPHRDLPDQCRRPCLVTRRIQVSGFPMSFRRVVDGKSSLSAPPATSRPDRRGRKAAAGIPVLPDAQAPPRTPSEQASAADQGTFETDLQTSVPPPESKRSRSQSAPGLRLLPASRTMDGEAQAGR